MSEPIELHSERLINEIEKRSRFFVYDNFNNPTKSDFIIIKNAMTIGVSIALENELTNEGVKMKKTEGELLREYARIVAEAQGNNYPEEYNPNDDELAVDDKRINDSELDNFDAEDNEIDLPDDSMQEETSVDPVQELASYLSGKDTNNMDFEDVISHFLKSKNLEITPIGGLSNSNGTV
jgi:hypothetical protein